VEGHVHELVVKPGEAVRKGQPIVELDKAVALADFAEKTATRDGLRASLVLLKSIPRPEERRPSELAIEQAKVALDRSKQAAQRLRPLFARHEVSEQQVLEADLAVTAAKLQQETAEAQLRTMMIGPRPEAVAEAESKIAVAEGAVAFSRAHLEFHTIRAPIDGVLDSLTCHPGQTIAIGTPIGEVVDTRQLFVSVFLPARAAQTVRVGQKAKVHVSESRSGSAKEEVTEVSGGEGTVDFVGRIADAQTGNLPVMILVENADGRLTLGQTMRVTITGSEHSGVMEVPSPAILDLGEGPVMSVVREGKIAVLHPELGTTHQGWMAISGTDLKEGEQVVVEGGYNLPEGTSVKAEAGPALAEHEASEGKTEKPAKSEASAEHEQQERKSEKSESAAAKSEKGE
jgi:RND family efflux transporter MFP subunit